MHVSCDSPSRLRPAGDSPLKVVAFKGKLDQALHAGVAIPLWQSACKHPRQLNFTDMQRAVPAQQAPVSPTVVTLVIDSCVMLGIVLQAAGSVPCVPAGRVRNHSAA